ncbi:TniQ family protein [Ruegeria sp. HKCCD6428]|uniref:TniQ family protein n=1 Tax=Ruegeria sp. HKCCD6428 TaxID=2683002 RepID=UPI001490D9A3|nr:TniQ family protein [Ruegeria sp. HKCCD6428]NOC85380.1 hypothetical protein [Ruegeria sp. HKCCD6428]
MSLRLCEVYEVPGLFAVPPLKGESLIGYLRRLAHVNGYRDVSEFLTRFRRKYGRILVENIEHFEQEMGLEKGLLVAISPSAKPESPSLSWRFERHHSDPICPSCLADGLPFQQTWRHYLVTACHHHKTRLQDVCPVCKTTLRPTSGGFDKCRCGFSYSNFSGVAAKDHEVIISALIAGDSTVGKRFLDLAGGRQVPKDIGAFINFLASGFAQNRTGKSGKTQTPKSVADSLELIEPLATVFDHWPNGFEEHVRGLILAGNSESNSVPSMLGSWYQRLMKFEDDAYQPFRDAVSRAASTEFKGTYLGKLTPLQAREWVSAKQAAKELGISAQRLVAEVQSGQIAGKQAHSGYGHRHTMIPRFEISNIYLDRKRYWNGLQARDYLGVTRKQFDLLRASELIHEVAAEYRPPLVDGCIDGESLKELTTNIRNCTKVQAGETIPFNQLNLRRTTYRAALMHVLQKISTGVIKPVVAEENMRLGEFHFSVSDIDRELGTQRLSKDWTANDVAKLTGWKAQAVTHWCKLGLLGSRKVPHGPSESFLVRPQQLAIFQSEYMPVATLARSRGTTSRKLLSDFESKGIETHGAQMEGKTTRGHLVKLSDLASLLSEAA